MIGRLIGNYKITERLDDDDVSTHYRATDTLLAREVLIKVLREDLAHRAGMLERFRLEAAVLARLNHPSVPALHALFGHEGRFFMVLERPEGETLELILARRGAFSIDEALPIFTQLFDCLEYAHKSGVTHGRLQTSELLLTEAGTLKVSGFGLAAPVSATEPAAEKKDSETPADAQKIDARTDIHALGMMLYEVLTGGSLPEPGRKTALKEAAPEDARAALPENIEAVIIKTLPQNFGGLFQNVADFRDALRDAGFAAAENRGAVTALVPVISAAEREMLLRPAVETPEIPAPAIVKGKRFWAASVSFSDVAGKFRENRFARRKEGSDAAAAPAGASFIRRQTEKHYNKAWVTIVAIVVLHFVLQFTFIQSENYQNTLSLTEAEQISHQNAVVSPEQKPRKPEVVKDPELFKEPSIVTMPDVLKTETAPPPRRVVPARSVIRDREPRETKAQRLRRAERILTGI
jgi:serine/threonine protein kinase